MSEVFHEFEGMGPRSNGFKPGSTVGTGNAVGGAGGAAGFILPSAISRLSSSDPCAMVVIGSLNRLHVSDLTRTSSAFLSDRIDIRRKFRTQAFFFIVCKFFSFGFLM